MNAKIKQIPTPSPAHSHASGTNQAEQPLALAAPPDLSGWPAYPPAALPAYRQTTTSVKCKSLTLNQIQTMRAAKGEHADSANR